ncbi:heterokaryon incompatibility protein-domain-containing protein [Dactylonectria estremocensis]|uniref:Heterokaryon incompatibility protein-domain-containing protein n=1 Tax=Dactylonectria estremocensis TaxID=1079267 RepID=A0A9P9DWF5_9HYPO|nr:heterokaryon incompatibility protein-domain-containing protein [Dactylonectria estremocensis]
MASKFLPQLSDKFFASLPDTICSHCQNLSPIDPEKSLLVEIALSQLKKSSAQCTYCQLLYVVYERYNISSNTNGLVIECNWGRPVVIKFKDTLNDHFSSWYLLYKPQGNPHRLGTTISSWPTLGDPGENLGHLGSEESFHFLKGHLDECLSSCDGSHQACEQPESKPLPRRVLDVRGKKVTLCNSAGQFGDYCALSYRWGPPEQTLRTTDINIGDIMNGIDLSLFPKLLQDAVTLTRRLGVPYLWIDALCIIQGNKKDWEAEAPKMGEYYHHAVLTISASLANEVSEPFLVPRDEIRKDLLSMFDFTDPDGIISQIIARRVPDYAGIPLVANSPLSSRAWTWQENVLSTRIAHFTKTEIIWECRSQQAFENGARLQCAVGLAYRFARAGDDLEYYWKVLVMEYSKRELTYESDRLPAISSVAAHFSKSIPGRYLAGVWEHWLFSDMVWKASWGFENTMPLTPKDSSEMPSWSWGSVTGQVHFALEACVESDKLSALKLIDADCSPSGGNPYGQTQKNASILVEAPVFTAELSCKDALRGSNYRVQIHEKLDTWAAKSLHKIRRTSPNDFLFHPDTVLLSDGTVTMDQGAFTSIKRAPKDAVVGKPSLEATVLCLHLGGGRYPELPNQTLSSISRYSYKNFWLVLAPVKEQQGPYPSLRRLGLLERSSRKAVRSEIARVRLV